MDRVAAAIGFAAMVLFATDSSSLAEAGRVRSAGLRALCPCTAEPFFESFVDGERELLTCTDDTPVTTFVRLVGTNLDLVVLFEFPPQKFCGWQRNGDYTWPQPVTTAQFRACQRLIVQAAGDQGLPCLPE